MSCLNNDIIKKNDFWEDNNMSFCPNCGTEVKEGARFCVGCGKPVDAQPSPTVTPPPQYTAQYSAPQYDAPKKAPKKSKKAGRVILGIIIAFIVIGIATSITRNNDKNTNDKEYSGKFTYGDDGSVSYTSGDELTEDEKDLIDQLDSIAHRDDANAGEPNPEYMAVFEDNGIFDESALLEYGHLTTSEHVTTLNDGIIDKMEYGSQNDKIKVIVETVYYPTAGYSDDQIAQVEQAMRDQFVAAESLTFCTITYTNIQGYLKIEVFMDNLDNKDFIAQAVEADILVLTDSNVDYLSHEMCKSVAQNSGYISKY